MTDPERDGGGEHPADVDEDVARELRVTRAQRLERLPAQALDLTVPDRAQRDAARVAVEELRLALIEFRRTYNESWLIERHGHRSPAQFRRDMMDTMPMAA